MHDQKTACDVRTNQCSYITYVVLQTQDKAILKTHKTIGWGSSSLTEDSTSTVTFEDNCQDIKDQGTCGSCWDFSATAQFEVNNDLYNDVYTSFSEQYVLDCVNSDTIGSCDGGLPSSVDEWLVSAGHCPTDSYSAYTGDDTETCDLCSVATTLPDAAACLSEDDFSLAVDTASQVAMVSIYCCSCSCFREIVA